MRSMKQLRSEIEAYLAATGMAPTRFGVEADRDRHLVRRVRAGKPVTMAKAERIMDYIRRNPPRSHRRRRGKVATAFDLCA